VTRAAIRVALFWSITDDAEGDIAMLADPIERRKQEIDVLVFDESPRKEHVVPLVGARRGPYLFGVDPVRNDRYVVAVGADLGESVGRNARNRDRMLRCSRCHVFANFSEDGKRAEVFLPILAPHLVPGRDKWGVCSESGKLRREDRKIREDAGDNDIVFVVRS